MDNAEKITINFPPTGKEIEVRFELDFLRSLRNYYPVQLRNVETAVAVLRNPKRIFSGIERIFTNYGFCFAGKPETWYLRESLLCPFPKDKYVYLVFLNDRYSVYEFRAEKFDCEDEENPENWRDRFGGLLWKKDS